MDIKKDSTLYIQADNVHMGGGELLLKSLIQSKYAENAYLILDARMPLDSVSSGQRLKIVYPKIFSRFLSQLWLWRNLLPSNTLLCFGNLPPLFNVKGKVTVFIQNRYTISDMPLKNFPIKIRIRIFFERLWFKCRCSKVNEFIVQTPSMKIALVKHLLTLRPRVADRANIKVIPFLEAGISENLFYSHRNNKPSKKFDFIYPASGEPHKNHQNLIDAFIILAEQGHYPSLLLTLNERSDSGLLRRIEVQKFKYKLKIHNMGFLPHHELLGLYLEARYLIYPSLYESFGIPLIEAKQAGLSIVAGELDYVRDSVDPYEVFDPHSPVSISRAIKRSLGIFDDISTVVNADSFLSQIYVKV